MNVLVIGTGAIGSYYGSLLAKGGAKVSVVARSDFEAVHAHGIDIHSDKLGDWHFQPAAVLRDAGAVKQKPDYILLCVKMIEGIDLAGLVRDAVGPDTAIVLIANGINVETPLATAFPRNELISGLAFICVTRTAPGKTWHQDYGRLAVGLYPKGASAKTGALRDAFESAGCECKLDDDIVAARWRKCLWNAAFNPLSVLLGGKTVVDILETSESEVRAIMTEVAAIAASCGHALPADAIAQLIEYSKKMAPYKTSMLVDFEAGRPMEIEAILGAPIRVAGEKKVPVPYLEKLYEQMQEVRKPK